MLDKSGLPSQASINNFLSPFISLFTFVKVKQRLFPPTVGHYSLVIFQYHYAFFLMVQDVYIVPPVMIL